jgi:hypothetical protein
MQALDVNIAANPRAILIFITFIEVNQSPNSEELLDGDNEIAIE